MCTEPEKKYCIESEFWGRIVGFIWDVSIAVTSLFVIPAALLYVIAETLVINALFVLSSMVLLSMAIFSFIFGVFWTFRGHRVDKEQ